MSTGDIYGGSVRGIRSMGANSNMSSSKEIGVDSQMRAGLLHNRSNNSSVYRVGTKHQD